MRPVAFASAAFVAAFVCLVRIKTSAGEPERRTTLGDQTSVNVTVYNGTSSLVHDRRRIVLAMGENHLAWRDVSAQIEPTSSLLQDLTDPGGASILEQNFDFDTLGAKAILQKYVGRDVTVVHRSPLPGQPRRETARLLTLEEGMVLKYRDRVETALAPDSHLEFPSLPADLRDRPTLVLDLESATAGPQDLDLAYLTGGLSWQADYVASLEPGEKRLDLDGTITLTNRSGTSFKNANLQLVAGDVHEATFKPGLTADTYTLNAAAPAPLPTPRQENLFDYHLYTLPRPTSILDNQTKQVAFIRARDIPLRKSYEVRGSPDYYRNSEQDLGYAVPVTAYATFTNKDGDLGIPLPAGTIRFYETDRSGTSQYLGRDDMLATPKNEDVRVRLGDAFDVTAVRKQTTFKIVSKCIFESAYDVEVANERNDTVDALIIEPIPGNWTMLAENVRHDKSSSETATWALRVPSNGIARLHYAVRVKVCS